jgi:hypothetical protein
MSLRLNVGLVSPYKAAASTRKRFLRSEALAVLRTIRDLKAVGQARPSMRYNPLRMIFWRLAKPYFRALLEELSALRDQIDANKTDIRPLSSRLTALEELVAESGGLNSEKDGQPAANIEPRVINGSGR